MFFEEEHEFKAEIREFIPIKKKSHKAYRFES